VYGKSVVYANYSQRANNGGQKTKKKILPIVSVQKVRYSIVYANYSRRENNGGQKNEEKIFVLRVYRKSIIV
jgi:hypothetical protein